jgi:hypothetical protein
LADNQTSKNLTLEFEVEDNQWIIFNVDETGKFRFLDSGSKKLLIYNVNRLLSGQLRRAQLEVDWPTTDDESHGHFSHQSSSNYERRAQLGESWPVGLRNATQFDGIPGTRRGISAVGIDADCAILSQFNDAADTRLRPSQGEQQEIQSFN